MNQAAHYGKISNTEKGKYTIKYEESYFKRDYFFNCVLRAHICDSNIDCSIVMEYADDGDVFQRICEC